MKEGTFYKLVSKREQGKQKRYFVEQETGLIDEFLCAGFSFVDGQFKATDTKTGALIASGVGMNIDYHIGIFYATMIDSLKNARSCYYYPDNVRMFEAVKEYGKPITERKLRNILEHPR